MKTSPTNTIGSEWRKWDLHIHTPASFHWKGERLPDGPQEARDKVLSDVVDAMNATDVAVFGIMDYWTFDGFIAIRDYLRRHPEKAKKCVLPGIEVRVEAPTNFRLNCHAIFSESISDDRLREFLATLQFRGLKKAPTRGAFIELGRALGTDKRAIHGMPDAKDTDEEKMLLLGLKTAELTRDSFEDAIAKFEKDGCLFILPFDTSDGAVKLDWKKHAFSDISLMQSADVFEAKDPELINLFLGRGNIDAELAANFLKSLGGRSKPVVRGSDAHAIGEYGKYPNDKITWLKADPNFAGLKQVCHEPSERCWIGVKPPKLENVESAPTKHIRSLKIEKLPEAKTDEKWFQAVDLSFNPGLVAIIGNKGSGKSALADILALLGNTRSDCMEFLNAERFRRSRGVSESFSATIEWHDGGTAQRLLSENSDTAHPERVRYLPQSAIERLCNEIAASGGTAFESELKKVIFSHVPLDDRIGKASLDELLAYKTTTIAESIDRLRSKMSALNREIVVGETATTAAAKAALTNELSLRQAELVAHEKTKPTDVPPPVPPTDDSPAAAAANELKAALEEISGIKKTIEDEEKKRAEVIAQKAAFERLAEKLKNLQATFDAFIAENQPEFAASGFDLGKMATLKIDSSELVKRGSVIANEVERITLALGAPGEAGLLADFARKQALISELRSKLDAPQKAYQQYLVESEAWTKRKADIDGDDNAPGTIKFLEAQIRAAGTTIPENLATWRIERTKLAQEIHGEIVRIRKEYESLYKPVQEFATSNSTASEALKIEFDAFLMMDGFEERFLALINQGRRGSFYGAEEGRKTLRQIMRDCDANDGKSMDEFLTHMLHALQFDIRGGHEEPTATEITSQLARDVKLADIYDFIFSLKYIEPRYTLKLAGKEISRLSPGEKGALLLVFYLLLDKEDVPIIIDQPEQNLDNESVVSLLAECFKRARDRRQVIIVTHNPNLAVFCDADQIIYSEIDKADGNLVSYSSGSIENAAMNLRTVNVLEGTYPAFDNRKRKYLEPAI
ncbi:MAG: hypothetical protein JNJ83_01210 [Verrucomicrobiaceae bacterium]|nr:hypothetical protein [Verrucomicrobiaceae bacterium]